MSGTTRTIVVNRHTPRVREAFGRLGRVVALGTQEITREALRDAEVLVVRSETAVNRELLEGTPVRFVGTVTIGTDHVDLEYLASRGIAFASAPGSNANSVAEYVAAALLVWARRTGSPLAGRSIGIVGVGNVGSRVGRVARALGMTVLLNDPPLARSTGDPSYRPLMELMEADVLTLHVPLTRSGPDATLHLFDEARLAMMKSGSLLINTSRGGVVDGHALAAGLSAHRPGQAVLDVWEGEPGIDAGLLNLTMLGTPHIAGYSLDGKLNAVQMIHDAVSTFLGVEPAWTSDIAPPADALIRLPEGGSDIDALSAAVRAAYDIEEDDRRLRGLADLTPSDRSRGFSRLRAEYGTRLEFRHRTVQVPGGTPGLRTTLEGLGFRTTGGDAA